MANLFTVRVSEQLTLDAGTWEEHIDQQQQPYRLITPPGSTMYEQVHTYLIEATKEQKTRPQVDVEEVAMATVAVCIRWGSSFAVLNNPDLPL